MNNVTRLTQQAEANRLANEQRYLQEVAERERNLRATVSKEVDGFIDEWAEELKVSGEEEVYKSLSLEEAQKIFSSVTMARQLLYGRGLKTRLYKERSTGFLWWKKIQPAWLEIFPMPEQKNS